MKELLLIICDAGVIPSNFAANNPVPSVDKYIDDMGKLCFLGP